MDETAKKLLDDIKVTDLWVGSKWYKLTLISNIAKGRFGENLVAEELIKQGHKAEVVLKDSNFDVLVNNKIKVEVKTGMARKIGDALVIDSMQWQHLDIYRSDVYVFIGINPEINYRIRKGWRTDIEEIFILYFTSEQLQEFAKINTQPLLVAQESLLQTGKAFLKRIEYGPQFRNFPL